MGRDAVNAYLLGDVLVDAGVKGRLARRLIAAVGDREVAAHAITHAHPDHVGGSAEVCRVFGLDGIAAGARDAADARLGRPDPGDDGDGGGPLVALAQRLSTFPVVAVTRELREGDTIGPGFMVLDVPGHSPGHVAFWREADGILIAGDVFYNLQVPTTIFGLRQPLRLFTPDPVENRRSERKLAALHPRIVGFGHGPVVREPGKLEAFVAKLARD